MASNGRGFREEYSRQCCGKCKYHWKNRETDGWYCANSQSDFFSMDTWYEDWCDEYEERDYKLDNMHRRLREKYGMMGGEEE